MNSGERKKGGKKEETKDEQRVKLLLVQGTIWILQRLDLSYHGTHLAFCFRCSQTPNETGCKTKMCVPPLMSKRRLYREALFSSAERRKDEKKKNRDLPSGRRKMTQYCPHGFSGPFKNGEDSPRESM